MLAPVTNTVGLVLNSAGFEKLASKNVEEDYLIGCELYLSRAGASVLAIHTNTGISTKILLLRSREIVRVSLQRKSNLPAKKAESGLRECWQQRSQPGGKPAGECRQPRSFCSECEHGWVQGNAGFGLHLPIHLGFTYRGDPVPNPDLRKSEKWGAGSRKGVRPFAFLRGSRALKRMRVGNRILPPK
ncbi:MAG: hypothetical protein WB622_13590 [Acidobacteriaceae bacterium]